MNIGKRSSPLLALLLLFSLHQDCGAAYLKCYNNDKDGTCIGDYCVAKILHRPVGSSFFHGFDCQNVSTSQVPCNESYPSTQLNVSYGPGYFFTHVFSGCCDNKDLCNGHPINLRYPELAYTLLVLPHPDPPTSAPSDENEVHTALLDGQVIAAPISAVITVLIFIGLAVFGSVMCIRRRQRLYVVNNDLDKRLKGKKENRILLATPEERAKVVNMEKKRKQRKLLLFTEVNSGAAVSSLSQPSSRADVVLV